MNDVIFHIVVHIPFAIVFAIVGWQIRRPAPLDPLSDAIVMTYATAWRCVAGAFFMMWTSLLVGLLSLDLARALREPLALFGGAAMFMVSAWIFVETMKVRLLVTANGIVGESPWRFPREIAWEEIVEIRFVKGVKGIRIVGRNGDVIRVPQMVRGTQELFAQFRLKLPAGLYEDAVCWYQATQV